MKLRGEVFEVDLQVQDTLRSDGPGDLFGPRAIPVPGVDPFVP